MTKLVRTMSAGAMCRVSSRIGGALGVDEFWSNGNKHKSFPADPDPRTQWYVGALAVARSQLEAERPRWFLWFPVVLSCGIAVYFNLPVEPPMWAVLALALLAMAFLWGAVRGSVSPIVAVGVVVAISGVFLGKARMLTGGPGSLILPYGIVELDGWLERMETHQSGQGYRLFVVPDRIQNVTHSEEVPRRVSLVWRGPLKGQMQPGDYIRLRAKFLPPPGPVWPGGYDPSFTRWFEGVGGAGFVLQAPEKAVAPGEPPTVVVWAAKIQSVRIAVAGRIRASITGPAGAVAVALITGDRTGIPDEIRDALRAAGLAHLLAISGLHMALFAGGVFWLLRALLALNEDLALRRPIKKWAAGAALVAASGYLMLSGAGLATQRAFIMISIMFLAIMIDRPALSMRNVALAALVILTIKPESVMSVSFQLSFFAVIALIALYEFLNARPWGRVSMIAAASKGRRVANHITGYMWSVGLTTLTAGLATAPIAAYHFNKAATYSLLGNLLAVPMVGILVMPAAIVALVAMPFGLETAPLWVMGQGIAVVMWVAQTVSQLPGSIQVISQISLIPALLIAFGFLWLCLWARRWRILGVGVIAAGALLAPMAQKLPSILVTDTAHQVAVVGPEGKLVFSSARAGKYAAERWLLKFGDPATFKEAVSRRGFSCDEFGCTIQMKGRHEVALVRHPAILAEECARATIVVVTFVFREPCPSAHRVITLKDLGHHGVHALFLGRSEPNVREGQAKQKVYQKTARSHPGNRPWTAKPKRYRKRRDGVRVPERPKSQPKPPQEPKASPAPAVQVRI